MSGKEIAVFTVCTVLLFSLTGFLIWYAVTPEKDVGTIRISKWETITETQKLGSERVREYLPDDVVLIKDWTEMEFNTYVDSNGDIQSNWELVRYYKYRPWEHYTEVRNSGYNKDVHWLPASPLPNVDEYRIVHHVNYYWILNEYTEHFTIKDEMLWRRFDVNDTVKFSHFKERVVEAELIESEIKEEDFGLL